MTRPLCKECKEPFTPSVRNQDTCLPCMTKPQPFYMPSPQQGGAEMNGPKPGTMMPCEKCGKEFEKTGHRQKFCPEHSARLKGKRRAKQLAGDAAPRRAAPKPKKKAARRKKAKRKPAKKKAGPRKPKLPTLEKVLDELNDELHYQRTELQRHLKGVEAVAHAMSKLLHRKVGIDVRIDIEQR